MDHNPANPVNHEPQPTINPTPRPELQFEPVSPVQSPFPLLSAQPEMIVPATPFTPPATPVTPPSSMVDPAPATNPGHIVLQWLTYALWGWTVLATSFLVAMVISSLLSDSDSGGFTTYGIAAVLVLLPFSVVADIFYSKIEETKKHGAASIIMIIHAVLFGLFGIGALISAVISVIIMITNGGNNSTSLTAFLSSGIIFFLYVATFIRTLNPVKLSLVKRFYIIFMVIVIGLISILGIVGPVAKERATRNDRLIVDNASSLISAISSYARENKKLPADLNNLDVSDDTKVLAESGLLTYTANIPGPTIKNRFDSGVTDTYTDSLNNLNKEYYYEICATFKEKSRDSSYGASSYGNDEEYSSYLSLYSHPAGKNCYKLSTSRY